MKDLSPDRWQQIDTLFAEALDRPPDERSAFLRHACGDDPDLYHAVSQLLDEMDAAAQVLGESVTDFAASLMPELEADLRAEDGDDVPAEHRIGPYRVVRPIGHGGMGTVYLAERADDQYHQQVALKLVRQGMDTQEIVQRFRYERQILASLEHPGIARLYDGGVSADGRPYLVMEYVDGQPIDAYCDAHRLSVAERLELFEAVCEAVQYAHRNTVVHRDLKPSNILVTEEGEVKLLDFGIAKLVAEEPASTAPRTRTGWRVMTPEYAAPEQVRGASVTTATDVYALGGVLYELLAGRRPLDTTARSAAEVEAVMLEQLPERPSTIVMRPITQRRRDGTTTTLTPDEVSAARGTTPARLRRQLQGDLDVMLLKALRKEPERRYPSAEALLDDIRRRRMGQPIAARRDSVRYRAAKFVRRHRVGVGIALVAAFVLIGLGLFHTTRITQERDRAQAEAARAQAAMTFMETLFEGADPDETLGDTLTVFELLDRGTMQVGQALQSQPDVQATTQHILGTLYLKLGAYDQAAPLLQEAVAVQEAGENAVTELLPHVNLAHLHVHTGAYDMADSLFRVGLARHRAAWGVRHANVASVLVDYGAALEEMGRYDEARTHLREALSILEQETGDRREDLTDARFALGTVYMNEGDYAAADSLFRVVLTARQALYGPTHSKVADALNNLGNSLYDQGDYAAADSLLHETLAIHRQLFGEDHPAVAETLNNLALVPYARGDYAAADSLMRVSLGIVERLVGREHPDAAMTLNNIGWVQLRQDDLDGAEATFRESLRIMKQVSGPVSPDAALLLGNVGFVLHKKGDAAGAEPFFREALTVRLQVHGPENMHVAWRQFALAEALRDLERYDEAETLHRESVAIRRALRPEGHFDIARGLNGLAGALADQGKHAEAATAYREALPIYQALYDDDHDTVVQVQGALGASLTAMGDFEAAESLLLQHYETLTASKGADHADTHAAIERLVTLYTAWGRSDQAASYRAVLAAGT